MDRSENRTTFEKLRFEVRDTFREFSYDELLDISNSKRIEKILRVIQNFIGENYKGISSSQLRLVLNRIEQTQDIGAVSFRSFLAFRIVRQQDDQAKRILLLFEELSRHIRTYSKTVETADTHIIQSVYENFARTVIAYHHFFEALGTKQEEHLKNEVETFFQNIGGLNQLLQLPVTVNVKELIRRLKEFVCDHHDKVKTHQLRKIHNTLLSIETLKGLNLLKPFLAYTIARQEKRAGKKLMMLFYALIEKCQLESDLMNLKKISESIIAFHKYYDKFYSARNKKEDKRKEQKIRLRSKSAFTSKKISLSDLLNRFNGHRYKLIEETLKTFIYDHRANLSSSQLRNVYEMVRQAKMVRDIQMIRPRLAFIIARQPQKTPHQTLLLLDELTKLVNASNLNHYRALFEDILAYHEYYATETVNS